MCPKLGAKLRTLPRPSVSAWVTNQLYWHARDAFDEMLAAAKTLRKGDLDVAQLFEPYVSTAMASGAGRILYAASPWLSTVAFFLIWELGCRLFDVPTFILPAPSQAVAALIQYWPGIWPNALHTLITTLIGFGIAVVFEVFSTLCFFLLPRPIARVFTHDQAVISFSVSLFRIAGVFQIFDGIQTVATGALMEREP